jgi:hypothetical protein
MQSKLNSYRGFHATHILGAEHVKPRPKTQFARRSQLVRHCLALLTFDLNKGLAWVNPVGL